MLQPYLGMKLSLPRHISWKSCFIKDSDPKVHLGYLSPPYLPMRYFFLKKTLQIGRSLVTTIGRSQQTGSMQNFSNHERGDVVPAIMW